MYSGAGSRLQVTGCRLQITGCRLQGVASCLLLTAYCLLFVVSCTGVDPVVKVGLVAPFEGEHRAMGYDVIYSARLAVREINEAGGINGVRVALVALDDGGDVEMARETAVSLVIDPAVVAVVGHFRPQTTAVAAEVYADEMPLIAAAQPPFRTVALADLPAAFRERYDAVSPFDELPGPFAAATYDAFNLLWLAMARAQADDGEITRDSVARALDGLEYHGLTGAVYQQP